MMLTFKTFITESVAADDKLKHLEHAEDHPINAGAVGFKHAADTLTAVHNQLRRKDGSNVKVTMKYDGSPSIVFGYHPETKKFFVASKSAFNVKPKINYTDQDIEANHGHAPGLVSKLKSALKHLPKVTPKTGVYQGDIMHTPEDVKTSGDTLNFKPNTITYSVPKDSSVGKKVARAQLGVAVHTKYQGKTLTDMKAGFEPDTSSFKQHPDVHMISVEHPVERTGYSSAQEREFESHMKKAKAVASSMTSASHKAVERHRDNIKMYINDTVRQSTKPTTDGLRKYITARQAKALSTLKTDKARSVKQQELKDSLDHLDANSHHIDKAFELHGHLQRAKDVLVHALSSNPGSFQHTIGGQAAKPEGFVAIKNGAPTKLVDRAEFSRANLLAARG
jgi:hypothetical protein